MQVLVAYELVFRSVLIGRKSMHLRGFGLPGWRPSFFKFIASLSPHTPHPSALHTPTWRFLLTPIEQRHCVFTQGTYMCRLFMCAELLYDEWPSLVRINACLCSLMVLSNIHYLQDAFIMEYLSQYLITLYQELHVVY